MSLSFVWVQNTQKQSDCEMMMGEGNDGQESFFLHPINLLIYCQGKYNHSCVCTYDGVDSVNKRLVSGAKSKNATAEESLYSPQLGTDESISVTRSLDF